MNNRMQTGKNALVSARQEELPEEKPVQEGRNSSGQFMKGVSGNPGGRPRRTPAEQQAVEMMKAATPEMVELILKIARSDRASFYARLQAAELILNRSMGKPETYLKVENAEQSVEEATASLIALFDAVRTEEDSSVSIPVHDPEEDQDLQEMNPHAV